MLLRARPPARARRRLVGRVRTRDTPVHVPLVSRRRDAIAAPSGCTLDADGWAGRGIPRGKGVPLGMASGPRGRWSDASRRSFARRQRTIQNHCANLILAESGDPSCLRIKDGAPR